MKFLLEQCYQNYAMRRATVFISLCQTHVKWSRQIHQQITVKCLPTNPKIDETIAIKFQNLPISSKVRLETILTSPGEKLKFLSSCIFPVDSSGTLDLTTTACDGPSYQGVDPMGIFWSMDPQPGSPTRLYSNGPLHYAMDLFDMDDQKLVSTSLVRNIYEQETSRQDVRTNGVVGTLFVPSGSGPFPAIVELDGAARIKEDVAAALASKGFVVLVLAFFRQEGLPSRPRDYSHVEVEYFERAIDMLQVQGMDFVQPGGVGVLGCDLSLSMATFLPLSKVLAVVTVNGAITSLACITSYGDTMIKEHKFRDVFHPKPGVIEGSLDFLGALIPIEEVSDECRIPFEESEADVLMIAGEDDHNFESAVWAEAARKNCEKYGKKNFSVLTFPGMGHALDAPFAPVATTIPHILAPKGTRIYLGGANKMAAARGQLESFNNIVNFFSSRLK